VSFAGYASFWGLCLARGAIVLLPGVARSRLLEAVRRRWVLFAAPVAAVIGVTFIPAVADRVASDVVPGTVPVALALLLLRMGPRSERHDRPAGRFRMPASGERIDG
jgi:hypothetical protein